MERKKSLPSQNVEKTILFVSDIDRTLIYPQRFARKGDVCIEWSEDGKELSYANPDNLEDLIKLSKLTKLVLVTARTEEQYRRIKWPEELEIHSVVINLGNDLLFSQEINPQEWNEKTDNSMKEHLEDLKNASKWLSEQEFVERCSIRNDRFTFARFNDKWNANEKRTLQDKLKSDFNCNCDLMGERLYLTIPGHDTDFEYKIMYQLYRELEMCKKNGTKLNISVDTETTGLNIYNLSENNEDRDHCVAIPISWKPDTAYVIFTDMEYFSNVPNQYAIDRLAQLFENFKGERTITIYEPPQDYWNENKVVTLQDVINASTGMGDLAQDANPAKESPKDSNTVKESTEDSNTVKGSQTTSTQVKQMSFFGNTEVVNQENSHQDSTNDFIDYAGSTELADFTDNFELTDNLNPFGEQSAKTTDDLTTTDALFHSINEQTQGETTLAQLYAYASKKSGTADDLAKTSKQIKFTFVRNLINLIGHNIMFDRRVFYMFGKSFYFNEDTLQMAFDLNPKTVRGSVALKGLTHRLLGHETPELSDILGKGNEDKYRYLYDILVAMVYGCADADYTLTIYHILRKLMTSRMYKEYKRQDVQMLNILSISEYYGM